jgi:DNA-binding beta-propeller fold protein YncE
VTDTGNSRVVKYSPDGDVLGVYGSAGSGPGQFREPVGIAIHSDDGATTIFVADAWNRRIQVFDGEFKYQREIRVESWGSQDVLAKPYLAVLPEGRLLFSDPANSRIGIADPETGAVTVVDRLPSGEKLTAPVGVAADQRYAYITDGRDNLVRRVGLDALISR